MRSGSAVGSIQSRISVSETDVEVGTAGTLRGGQDGRTSTSRTYARAHSCQLAPSQTNAGETLDPLAIDGGSGPNVGPAMNAPFQVSVIVPPPVLAIRTTRNAVWVALGGLAGAAIVNAAAPPAVTLQRCTGPVDRSGVNVVGTVFACAAARPSNILLAAMSTPAAARLSVVSRALAPPSPQLVDPLPRTR